MKKLLFVLLVVSILMFSIGCSNEEQGKKLSSRPVQAKPVESSSEPASEAPVAPVVSAPVTTESTPVAPVETKSVVAAGQADCEVLSSTDIAAVFGGTWTKTADCPQRPAMPKGVNVCLCSFDGPKQVYVNVEAQLYGDANEASRVFDMYCKGATPTADGGDKSCRREKSSVNAPAFVYFLKGNEFVKISCLGGSCPLDAIAAVSKSFAEKI